MKKITEVGLFKYILASLCLTLLISGIFLNYAGKKQDAIWLSDYQAYEDAVKLAQQKEYDEAAQTLKFLAEKYNSATLYWVLARTTALADNRAEAGIYYERAREIYPAIVLNPDYARHYGVLLAENGKYEKAEKYLQSVLKYTNDPEEKELVKFYLENIEQSSGN